MINKYGKSIVKTDLVKLALIIAISAFIGGFIVNHYKEAEMEKLKDKYSNIYLISSQAERLENSCKKGIYLDCRKAETQRYILYRELEVKYFLWIYY